MIENGEDARSNDCRSEEHFYVRSRLVNEEDHRERQGRHED